MGNKVSGMKQKVKRKWKIKNDPESRRDQNVQRGIIDDRRNDHRVKKILLLGTLGSGKSTIFRRLRQIYGEPMTRVERRHYVQYIHEQCITEMKHALNVLNDFQEETNLSHDVMTQNYRRYIMDKYQINLLVFGYIGESQSKWRSDSSSLRIPDEIVAEIIHFFDSVPHDVPDLSDQGMEYADYVQSLHHTKYRLNDEIVNALKELWKEPAIKRMYDLRNITGIEDSTDHFWDILDTIVDLNYIPDLVDTLSVRKRTTGVTEAKYEMKDRPGGQTKGIFNIVDIGGAKSERLKWATCYDSVTAVIFVASLSCYDKVMFEDLKSSRMTNQLQLFDNVINNPSLSKTSMILFLNKRDLFAEKIKAVPLSKCKSFATYRGDADSFDQTTRYIRKAFCSLNQNPTQRNIFTHITCATDTVNVQKVFTDVQHIVIQASLIQAGLMDWDDQWKYPNDGNIHDDDSTTCSE